MSGRAKMWLADGRFSTARKTLTRRIFTPKQDRPDTRLLILLPASMALYAPGPTGIMGVSIEPGPIVASAGKDVEWVHRQLALWLRREIVSRDVSLSVSVQRDGETHGEVASVHADGMVAFIRGGGRKPLRFER